MPENHHLIEIDSVLKTFNTHQLLTDVYLKCETKDIIAIFGRNGSGKTTLLKIIFGTMNADRKFIRLDSTKVLNKPYRVSKLISYLPQDTFLPNHTSMENLVRLYLPEEKCASFFEDDEIVYQTRQRKPVELSDGIQRYLELKLLLFSDFKFLLLDEPFKMMSPLMIEEALVMIKEHSANKGIIITDHRYEYVMRVATEIFLLDNGVIRKIKDKQELIHKGYLIRL